MIRLRLPVLLIFAALALLTLTPAAAQDATPRFEPYECQFETDFMPEVTCGFLYVKEDRTNPDPNSTELQLHVAIFHGYSPSPAPDPVVYLDGGPGSNALDSLQWSFPYFEPFLERRDFIIFDQRGTGFSGPLPLQCDEYGNMLYDTLDERLSAETMSSLTMEAMTRCRDRLTGRGVNLAAYNSRENAADLEDLRAVLNYSSWNLYGISYGTRLALTAMRDEPTGIRSVIIDGVLPLQVSLYDEEPANAERALNVLFLHCSLDPECDTHYPNLGTVFYDVVTRLNAQPAETIIMHPVSGREYTVLVDGDRLVGLVFAALYSAELIPLLPKVIYDVNAGDYTLLGSTLEGILYDQEGVSMGMHFSVQCSEEAPFTSAESVRASVEAFPMLGGYFDDNPNTGQPLFALCDMWGTTPPDPVENAPVSSFIPTLVMSGEFDPITPPRWGREAAETLPNSFVYEIPGVGHGSTVSSPCAMDMALEFLDNPTVAPDSSCIADIEPVEFFVVDNSIQLVPFSDPSTGISGVYPESWMEIIPGMYARSMADEEALVYAALPGVSEDQALDLVLEQFDLYVAPQAKEVRHANGFLWHIYEFRQGERILDVAMAEQGYATYWVLLVSKRYEQPQLYQSVLLPAVDSMRLI